jgi:hypothetical protein
LKSRAGQARLFHFQAMRDFNFQISIFNFQFVAAATRTG